MPDHDLGRHYDLLTLIAKARISSAGIIPARHRDGVAHRSFSVCISATNTTNTTLRGLRKTIGKLIANITLIPLCENAHKLIQDEEFDKQLDAIHSALVDDLDFKEIRVLDAQDADIEEDDENAHVDEVFHHLAYPLLLEDLGWVEEFAGFIDVEGGDDDLLHDEECYLDALPNLVFGEEFWVVVGLFFLALVGE
jgi:hypothetical protein